ncbi:MAG: transposase [Paludibacteraceae bacterium]
MKELNSAVRMMRNHENEIIIFFYSGQTNAKVEILNEKINRFISDNYKVKDKDFALYRIAKYFS